MSEIEELGIAVTADTSDAESGLSGLSDIVDAEFAKMAGAALTGAGVMVEAFARSQQAGTVELGRLATATGMTEGELRSLVGELDNVTFSTGDVTGVLANASQQGIRTAEDMKHFAETWDMVADATGEGVVELSAAGVALKALDIDDPAEALDAFGFIAQETTGSVGDFLRFVERTGPQLRDLNLDVNDAAAIMGVLEHEMGMTGRMARTEFRKAVNAADGDLGKMLDTLGVSPGAFDAMRDSVDGSGASLEANAQKYADSFTPLQRLQSWVGETAFQFGGMGEAAGIAGGALSAMGTPMLAISQAGPAMSALGGATTRMKGAMVALRGAMVAHPIMAFAAVAAGVTVAFMAFRDRTSETEQRIDDLAVAMRSAESAADGLVSQLNQFAQNDDFARVIVEAGTNTAEMADAALAGGEAWQTMRDRLIEGAEATGASSVQIRLLDENLRDYDEIAAAAAEQTDIYAQATSEASTEMRDASLAMDALRSEAGPLADAMDDLDDGWHDLNDTLGLTQDELAALADSLGDVDVAAAMSEVAMGVVNDAMADVEAKADELRNRVDSAFTAGAASINKFSDEAKNSLGNFKSDMNQNIWDLTAWQNNLIAIAERGGAGFALEIAELGPEFAGMVDELAGTTDEEFDAVMSTMVGMTDATQRDMAAEFAKVDPEFKKTLDGVAGMTQLEMIKLEMKASQEAFAVGQALSSGMEAGIGAGAAAIAARAARTVTEAMDAARAAGGITSPSKLFADEVGKPIAQGIAVGMEREMDATFEPAIGRVFSNMTATFRPVTGTGSPTSTTAVNIEHAEFTEGVDVDAVMRSANLLLAGA